MGEAPANVLLDEKLTEGTEVMETVGSPLAVTVIVVVLLVAGLPVAQAILLVMRTLTWSPFTKLLLL